MSNLHGFFMPRSLVFSSQKAAMFPESLCDLYEFFTRSLWVFACDGESNTKNNYRQMPFVPRGQIAQPSFSEEDRTSDQKGIKLHCMRGLLRKAVAVSTFPSILVLSLALAPPCYAQTQAQPEVPTKVAELHEPATDATPARAATAPDPQSPVDVAKELAAMKARIELLEAELKSRTAATEPPLAAGISTRVAEALPAAAPAQAVVAQTLGDSSAAKSQKPAPTEPFAYADWTWLNGNARNKDAVWDSKFFTPEIRFDTHFVSSFNHPKDDSLGGSTEIFRSNEIQLEQISFGGDFHHENVRGRVLTMGGMFAVTTPRNDASVGRGQWDLRGAYKYFSEAWGGYHFNVWQSDGRFGNRPGLRGQILYRPKPWLSLVFNNYGMGEDTLGLNGARSRIHTDDSVEIKYYDKPNNTLDKMAFSFTADAGCEYGGGAACFGNKKSAGQITAYKQAFLGWMLYNRFWFKKDVFGLTLGGGVLNNPGRYLALLPPINGADAVSGSPYFPESPGLPFKAWDASATFDWMPKQYITFRWEYGYRHADQNYFTGRGGITPPGGNNGVPAQFVCLDNAADPTGACSGHGGH